MKHIQRIERRADFQMLTGGSRLLDGCLKTPPVPHIRATAHIKV